MLYDCLIPARSRSSWTAASAERGADHSARHVAVLAAELDHSSDSARRGGLAGASLSLDLLVAASACQARADDRLLLVVQIETADAFRDDAVGDDAGALVHSAELRGLACTFRVDEILDGEPAGRQFEHIPTREEQVDLGVEIGRVDPLSVAACDRDERVLVREGVFRRGQPVGAGEMAVVNFCSRQLPPAESPARSVRCGRCRARRSPLRVTLRCRPGV